MAADSQKYIKTIRHYRIHERTGINLLYFTIICHVIPYAPYELEYFHIGVLLTFLCFVETSSACNCTRGVQGLSIILTDSAISNTYEPKQG